MGEQIQTMQQCFWAGEMSSDWWEQIVMASWDDKQWHVNLGTGWMHPHLSDFEPFEAQTDQHHVETICLKNVLYQFFFHFCQN